MLDPYIGAYELRELLIRKQVRPREVAEFFLARVERLNPGLGAFMTVTADRALEDAARLEGVAASARAAMLLFGIPASRRSRSPTASPGPVCRSASRSSDAPADESTILAIAAVFEEARPWADLHPRLD
jgi:Asp-tRNA(Asn)/Glu-tRNA(Gln) amidotransferase A subunit family amidase